MNILLNSLNNHIDIFRQLSSDSSLQNEILSAGDKIFECICNKKAVYLFGNGGSAADAQHIATEFVSRFYNEREAMNAEALTVNTSTITAIANDYSYNRVFSRQLEAKGRKGDVAIGISTSGKSKNVLNALDEASNNGLYTILLTSRACRLINKYDLIIRIPSNDTPRIQEMHIFIGHIWAEYVERRMIEKDEY